MRLRSMCLEPHDRTRSSMHVDSSAVHSPASARSPGCHQHLALWLQGFQEDAAAPLVCLTNGGGIRADLPAGDVTFGDVTAVLPFGNTVEVLEVSGATLRSALEHGYSAVRLLPHML